MEKLDNLSYNSQFSNNIFYWGVVIALVIFINMISADMLEPITTAITSNLTTLVPIGITILGTMIGVSLIPRIVYKFL